MHTVGAEDQEVGREEEFGGERDWHDEDRDEDEDEDGDEEGDGDGDGDGDEDGDGDVVVVE